MRGRKPTLKALPGALKAVPSPPKWLPEAAKAEWRRAARDLVDRRVLTDTTLATLTSYCLATGIVRSSTEAIDADGATCDGKRHPAFQNLFDAMRQARQLAAELGLTPTSRSKIPEGADDDDDALVAD